MNHSDFIVYMENSIGMKRVNCQFFIISGVKLNMATALMKLLSACHCRTPKLHQVSRNYSQFYKIRLKHIVPQVILPQSLGRTVSNDSNSSQSRHRLLIATYISFGIGGILLSAIAFREIKKVRLRWRGIVEIDDPAWRRVKLYKYKDCAIPGFVVNQIDDIENFEVKEDDVWVISFPRSGKKKLPNCSSQKVGMIREIPQSLTTHQLTAQ